MIEHEFSIDFSLNLLKTIKEATVDSSNGIHSSCVFYSPFMDDVFMQKQAYIVHLVDVMNLNLTLPMSREHMFHEHKNRMKAHWDHHLIECMHIFYFAG